MAKAERVVPVARAVDGGAQALLSCLLAMSLSGLVAEVIAEGIHTQKEKKKVNT